jgi:hypothetical protein
MHQLRHWFATKVYASSLDPNLTQELLGHIDPRTTAFYLAFSPVKASEAVRHVERPSGADERTVVCCSHCKTRAPGSNPMRLCRRCYRYQIDHSGRLPPPECESATARVLAAVEHLGRDTSLRKLAEEAGVHKTTAQKVLQGRQPQRDRDARRLQKLSALYTTRDPEETPDKVAARMPEQFRDEYLRLAERSGHQSKKG